MYIFECIPSESESYINHYPRTLTFKHVNGNLEIIQICFLLSDILTGRNFLKEQHAYISVVSLCRLYIVKIGQSLLYMFDSFFKSAEKKYLGFLFSIGSTATISGV